MDSRSETRQIRARCIKAPRRRDRAVAADPFSSGVQIGSKEEVAP